MAQHHHAIVWLDHHEAKVIHFNATESDEEHVKPADAPSHLHIKAGSAAGTHVTVEPAFFHDVAKACDEVAAVLLVGPSTAKTEFMTYLKKHSPGTVAHIADVEPMQRVTDNQLRAEGRRYFAGADRMTPQA